MCALCLCLCASDLIQPSKRAICTAEQYIDGKASKEELELAFDSASHALVTDYSSAAQAAVMASYIAFGSVNSRIAALNAVAHARPLKNSNADVLRDIINPNKPNIIITPQIIDLAQAAYDDLHKHRLAVLADALVAMKKFIRTCVKTFMLRAAGCWI